MSEGLTWIFGSKASRRWMVNSPTRAHVKKIVVKHVYTAALRGLLRSSF